MISETLLVYSAATAFVFYCVAKHLDILMGPVMLVFTCSKFKVTLVVTTEVEHTVMITLQHAYAYLYVS